MNPMALSAILGLNVGGDSIQVGIASIAPHPIDSIGPNRSRILNKSVLNVVVVALTPVPRWARTGQISDEPEVAGRIFTRVTREALTEH